jgi:hypothetical protein
MAAIKIRGTGQFPTEWSGFDLAVDVSDKRIALSGPAVCDLWAQFEGAGLGNQTFEIEWTQRLFSGCHLAKHDDCSGSVQRVRTQLAFDFDKEDPASPQSSKA